MGVDKFLIERSNKKTVKYRTVNIDENLHRYLKRIASYHDIHLADLMYHIIEDWKTKYGDEIKKKMLSDL